MEELLKKTGEGMDKSIDALEKEYASIRAGRANPAVLDKLLVDYYGTPTPINQMAAISVYEARTLVIQPWDASSIKDIERAINSSDLGINPSNDGKVIRMSFPPLTEERRKDIVKQINKYSEECKVKVRNIRREAVDKFKLMKKNSEITEDDLKNMEKKVQDITDKHCKTIDEIAKSKEKEIMEI